MYYEFENQLMKIFTYKLTRVKSWAMTLALFILLTICTKSASSQNINITSALDPDLSMENWAQPIDGG